MRLSYFPGKMSMIFLKAPFLFLPAMFIVVFFLNLKVVSSLLTLFSVSYRIHPHLRPNDPDEP